MKRAILILIVLAASPARGDAVVDSLTLDAALEDLSGTQRTEFLHQEARRLLRHDAPRALRIARRGLRLAEDMADDRARNQALMDIGVAQYYQGQYKAALRSYEEALGLAVSMGDRRLQAAALNNIGILYFVWGEHNLALQNYLQMLSIDLELGFRPGMARAYNNIAGVHQTAGRYDSALEQYARALELYQELEDSTNTAGTLNNIGLVEIERKNFQQALDALQQALTIERRTGDRSGEALSRNNMGMVRMAQGHLNDAGRDFAAALRMRQDIGDKQGEAATRQLMGRALVDSGELDQGITMLEQALALCRELGILELTRDCLRELSLAWEKAGRLDKALEYARLHKEAHDQLFDEQSNRRMAAAEARFELDLKDQEIDGLRREAEYEAIRRKLMLMAAGLLLIIILLLGNRYRFQKRANTEIQAKNAALEQAARTELAHVARVATMGELTAAFAHELNQPLAAIKANVRAARNLRGLGDDTPDEVDDALQDIRDDAERAREIIQRLRAMMRKGEERREPCDLNEAVAAVVKIIDPVARKQGVALRLELAEDLPRIAGDRIQLQQVLLNLVQNSLAAMVPAGGSITIRSRRHEDGTVRVAVLDQGPPVAPEVLADMFTPFYTTKANGLGMGLPICRTIIEAHGGRLQARARDEGGLAMELELSTG